MEPNTVVLGEIAYTVSRSFRAEKTASDLLMERLAQDLKGNSK